MPVPILGWALISRLPAMRTPSLASPPEGSRASVQSDRHPALARVYKTALRYGESSSHIFPHFPSPVCVHKVSQVGAEQARIELQVVILERLGTAAILTVHLAQVSQVDQVQRQVVREPSGLADRLSKLVPITNARPPRSPDDLAGGLGSWLPISDDWAAMS